MTDELNGEDREARSPTLSAWKTPQIAEIGSGLGPARFRARVAVTPVGILAIGVLVSSILLSASAVVRASTALARHRPISSRFKRR